MNLVKTGFGFLAFILFIGCANNEMSPASAINDSAAKEDSIFVQQAFEYRSQVLKKFKDTFSFDTNRDYYHLLYYDAWGNGISMRFEKENSAFILRTITLKPSDSLLRHAFYETKITEGEWVFLEDMIDDFNLWESPEAKVRTVPDGHTYFLEVNRKTNEGLLHEFRVRRCPRYDRIEALCNYIHSYQEELVFKYKQLDGVN